MILGGEPDLAATSVSAIHPLALLSTDLFSCYFRATLRVSPPPFGAVAPRSGVQGPIVLQPERAVTVGRREVLPCPAISAP